MAEFYGGILLRHLMGYFAVLAMHVLFVSGFLHWCHGLITQIICNKLKFNDSKIVNIITVKPILNN